MAINHTNNIGTNVGITPVGDVIGTPTIGTATDVGTNRPYNNGAATVTFTPQALGGYATSWRGTSTPNSITSTGTSNSSVTVSGLQPTTSYTFKVNGINEQGEFPQSSSSNSITATTVPDAPSSLSATVTDTSTVSISLTPPASGGKSITGYSATSSPSVSLTVTSGTSSTVVITGTFGFRQSYTIYVSAINNNGTGLPGSVASVLPFPGTLYTTTITTSGNWTVPALTTSVEVLAIGGGGGGAYSNTGGGAGGGKYSAAISVTPGTTSYITVGAGGNDGGNSRGNSGGASIGLGLTGNGGGGGGGGSTNGGSGGSGYVVIVIG